MSTVKLLNTICIVAVWLCSTTGADVFAQKAVALKVQGTVINDFGKPVEGVLLSTESGNTCVTARDGAYMLTVDGSDITVSAKGYRNRKIATVDIVEDDKIKLAFDPHHTGGFVNVGYFSLPKESFPGSAVSVTGKELDKSPTNVFSETFAGHFLGLHEKQEIIEETFFGNTNVSRMIRGRNSYNGYSAIVIIDGIICPNQYWEFLSPKEIESVTVLKDGATNAIYGIQGANGIIVITTKRGYTGKKKVEAYADYSLQQMTKRPSFVSSLQYAELRNQAGINDGRGAFSQFSETELEGYRTGDDMYYPNNNWYDMFVKKSIMRQRAGVNLAGGNEKINYFSNVSFLHQEEPIKVASEPDRKYDPNPDVMVANFRSNIDVKLNNYLAVFMRLTGNVKREMWAGFSENRTHYSSIFSLPPTMSGPLTPVSEDNPDAGTQVVTTDATDGPTYGSINRSGFTQVIETNVIA
jgi:TonB-dependent SusC/RagA subfamily outer membrane receptor